MSKIQGYAIRLGATNSGGTATATLTLCVDPAQTSAASPTLLPPAF